MRQNVFHFHGFKSRNEELKQVVADLFVGADLRFYPVQYAYDKVFAFSGPGIPVEEEVDVLEEFVGIDVGVEQEGVGKFDAGKKLFSVDGVSFLRGKVAFCEGHAAGVEYACRQRLRVTVVTAVNPFVPFLLKFFVIF